jgi:hypothetical protein
MGPSDSQWMMVAGMHEAYPQSGYNPA